MAGFSLLKIASEEEWDERFYKTPLERNMALKPKRSIERGRLRGSALANSRPLP
jgi:hypothetical protein